jgi:hypothetical protein
MPQLPLYAYVAGVRPGQPYVLAPRFLGGTRRTFWLTVEDGVYASVAFYPPPRAIPADAVLVRKPRVLNAT